MRGAAPKLRAADPGSSVTAVTGEYGLAIAAGYMLASERA
ncbi:hypothetical protein FBY35_2764 [Streptomyces sp. SLBN-118]|nr:hypothetical protein FBY35_2764 [Streptomyces sp. SLBN-118]